MNGRRTILLAGLIVAAGVAFRIWAVGYARFTGDESYFWATARNIATFQAAPVFGPPLTGSEAYHPGPIFYYLMAVPQALGASPWIGGIFVALLHGLAAWLLFLIALRAAGERAALIGLALWCFAPWDVLYADRIWLSCVAPVWGTLTIYAAHRAAASARWQGALIFFALVCPQLHMSAPVVWIACALLLWFDRPERWSRTALAAGLALAIAAYLPPVIWELRHNFENTTAIVTKGGGKLDLAGRLEAPLRVFGYAVLYGSSEIGYHFARGYWAPFEEGNYYASAKGAKDWLQFHGLVFAAGNIVSVLLAFAGWIYATIRMVKSFLRARKEGGVREGFLLADRLTLGLWLALIAGAILMIAAKKEYFPHYTNLLMPIAVWPVVLLLDHLLAQARLRATALAVLAFSMFAMAANVVRYYRDIDALNGLQPTLEMVDRAMDDAQHHPIALYFDGFNNGFAWQMLANTKYRKPLTVRPDAPVRYRVRNGAPHQGGLPPNTELYGPVAVERVQVRPK